MVRSYANSITFRAINFRLINSFFKKSAYHFASGSTTLYSQKQCTWVPIFPNLQHHLHLLFFIVAIWMDVMYLTTVLICISLITPDVKHLFMFLLPIYIPLLEKCLFMFFKQFSSVAKLCPTRCNPWTAARQASLPITNSWSLLKLTFIESVMPSNHLIFIHLILFLLPSIFPSIRVFSNESALRIRWRCESIGVSASTSVLLMNTQDWSPSGWTGWISLQSKGLSRVFSNTTVQKHQSFGAQLSL